MRAYPVTMPWGFRFLPAAFARLRSGALGEEADVRPRNTVQQPLKGVAVWPMTVGAELGGGVKGGWRSGIPCSRP